MTNEETLRQLVLDITPVSEEIARETRASWDDVAKPLDGLGVLEDIVVRVCSALHARVDGVPRRAVVVFCADNGVVDQGVSQAPRTVTAQVAHNICQGKASVCCMARVASCDVVCVDVGMEQRVHHPSIVDLRVAAGTHDISQGPAMTRDMACQAILAGAQTAQRLADEGYQLLASGEMGIGNTTTSSAVASVLLNLDPEQTCGTGAGASAHMLAHKIEVVRRALAVNDVDDCDPIGVVAALGGFDIAAMAGFALGCARAHVPCVIDGLISTIAALVAVRICPACAGYLVASHVSSEPVAPAILRELGLTAPITASMKLGEGTGAVALMSLIDMAFSVLVNMPTFSQTHIDAYQRFEDVTS